jgi:hypothetical protein
MFIRNDWYIAARAHGAGGHFGLHERRLAEEAGRTAEITTA